MGDVPAGAALAVPARLSQVLTAFIIECDNQFEQRMPHRTTRHGSSGDLRHPPWLVSMAMWANCLRFVPPGGIAAGELARRARLARPSMDLILTRMSQWWGYLAVAPGPAAARLVTPTRAGRQAQEIWAPLPGEIEERWRQRFGPAVIAGLRAALVPAAGRAERLPDFLPVGQAEPADGPAAAGPSRSGLALPELALPELALPELLSKVLLTLALDFERESGLSLGVYTSRGAARLEISANVLRVLADEGTQVR
ncbi:MAG TPA: hypothetical protein VGH88_00310, partial [Streptosporangiaceae bacterium]